MTPRIIAFEGPHGSGKTTQAKKAARWLRETGFRVAYVKTPHDSALRKLAARSANTRGRNRALLAALLHAADRSIVQEQIRRLSKKVDIVLVDRWILSSVVYQGIQGLTRTHVLQLNTGILRPDVTIVLHCPTAIRVKRLEGGQRRRRGLMFSGMSLQREQRLYSSPSHVSVGRCLKCDASGGIEDVHDKIVALIQRTFLGLSTTRA